MSRCALEVADVFRQYGGGYRERHGASPAHRRVMTAIELCRTAALGGHVEMCDRCGHKRISYNSCRDRHCTKCQSLARAEWLEQRKSEVLSTHYYHVVFTVPQRIAGIAYQNNREVYNILFRTSAETLRIVAADPKHLGAELGFFAVLHTWGQSLLHHPHLHFVIAGGGISKDGTRWVPCRPDFFLPVRVLARLFRRLFLAALEKAFAAGSLQFFSSLEPLRIRRAFMRYLVSVRRAEWVVYAKRPFAGPEEVLKYVARYTHRVAISNSRLVAIDDNKVSFRWKDYRNNQQKIMTLAADEFIRRFLIHILPEGFQRIRYYGFLANSCRKEKLARCRQLLNMPPPPQPECHSKKDYRDRYEELTGESLRKCPVCENGQMIVTEVLQALANYSAIHDTS